MAAATSEDLRRELRRFAETELRKEISEVSTTIQQCLENVLKKTIDAHLQAHHFSPQRQTDVAPQAQYAPPRILPSQPSPSNLDQNLSGTEQGERAITEESAGKDRNPPEGQADIARQGQDVLACILPCQPSAPNLAQHHLDAKDVTKKGNGKVDDNALGGLDPVVSSGDKSKDEPTVDLPAWHTAMPVSSLVAEDIIPVGHVSTQQALLAQSPPSFTHGKTTSDFKIGIRRTMLRRVIESDAFEYCIFILIISNAILMGIETELEAQEALAEHSPVLAVLEFIMLLVFSVEIGLRFFVFRCWLFRATTPSGARNKERWWNVFDCIIIGIGILEWAVELIADDFSVGLKEMSALRVLRVVRIGRLIRMGKFLGVIAPLRKIMHSVSNTLNLFFWVVLLLYAMNYIFALYFTGIVTARKLGGGINEDLQQKFGALWSSQRTLFATVTGGIDWLDVYFPLKEQLGSALVIVPFLFYLSFHVFCLLNVALGLFMDAASRSGQQATEAYLLQRASNIFQAADHDHSGKIRIEDFEATLDDPEMCEFFDAIDLDMSQAGVFFHLLDRTEDGLVSCAEFLCGCLRVRGAAKALDLLVLSREVGQLFATFRTEAAARSQALQQILMESAEHTRLLQKLVPATRED